jgi:hypothetical protein
MGDPYKKVKAGDALKLSATAWNAMLDIARGSRSGATGAGAWGGSAGNGIILFLRNDSGAAVPMGGVLGLGEPMYDYSDDPDGIKTSAFTLTGTLPDAQEHASTFAVALEPVAKDAIGRFMIEGVCSAKVSVAAEGDAFAGPKSGEVGYLDSGTSGSAAILWKETGTGEKWAVVRFLLGGGVGSDHCTVTVKNETGDVIRPYTAVGVKELIVETPSGVDKGSYDADTNTPDLESGAGILLGWYYKVSQAGDFAGQWLSAGDYLRAEKDSPAAPGDWSFHGLGFLGTYVLKVERLSVPKHHDNFVIALETIAAGERGSAAKCGIVPVSLVVRDQEHHWAELIDLNLKYLCSNEDPDPLPDPLIEVATDHVGTFRIVWRDPDAPIYDPESADPPEKTLALLEFPYSVPVLYRATHKPNMTEFTIQGKPAYPDGSLAAAPGGEAPDYDYTFQIACLEVTCGNCVRKCKDFTTAQVVVSGFRNATHDTPTPGTDCTSYNGTYALTKASPTACTWQGSGPFGYITIECDDTDPLHHVWRMKLGTGVSGEGTIEIGEHCGQGVYALDGDYPGSACLNGGSANTAQSGTATVELT